MQRYSARELVPSIGIRTKLLCLLIALSLSAAPAIASPPPIERFTPATQSQHRRVEQLCSSEFEWSEQDEIVVAESLVLYRLDSECVGDSNRKYCKAIVLRGSNDTECSFSVFTRANALFIDDLEDPESDETYILDAEEGAVMIRSLPGHIELRILR